MSQLQAKLSDPLRDDLPKFLSTRGMRAPSVRSTSRSSSANTVSKDPRCRYRSSRSLAVTAGASNVLIKSSYTRPLRCCPTLGGSSVAGWVAMRSEHPVFPATDGSMGNHTGHGSPRFRDGYNGNDGGRESTASTLDDPEGHSHYCARSAPDPSPENRLRPPYPHTRHPGGSGPGQGQAAGSSHTSSPPDKPVVTPHASPHCQLPQRCPEIDGYAIEGARCAFVPLPLACDRVALRGHLSQTTMRFRQRRKMGKGALAGRCRAHPHPSP